ncbi:hypothetical protein OG599_35395 (plasmid) [Streptomyces sp. NBC_01335]|uniref:hypothetical protein n=1 Tax=Streptomyces sp. NBC_01335 TaxID=2903828 RepID=UPI002E150100|nr:hypothetical protein OG599_35395 [Streptomyces sp. NBC_01335]
MDIDPEMHMYDCPGTNGRGCETCEGWEGRTFDEIRAELAGTPAGAPAPGPILRAQEADRTGRHADHCDRFAYDGGICNCADDYDREPPNMADLEDGIDARW